MLHLSVLIPLHEFKSETEEKIIKWMEGAKMRYSPIDIGVEEYGLYDINFLVPVELRHRSDKAIPDGLIQKYRRDLQKLTGIERLRLEQFED